MKSTLVTRYGLACFVLLLSGCCFFRSHRPPPDAIPPATGSLSVAPASDFVYAPAQAGRVSPNRIENTAVASIVLKKNIDVSVRDAVAATLKRAGIDTTGNERILTAHIETFLVEDARAPAWWTLKMRYILVETDTQRVLYTSTKTVRRQFRTFTSNTIALEDTVRANVVTLLRDQEFVHAVQ